MNFDGEIINRKVLIDEYVEFPVVQDNTTLLAINKCII